MGKSGTGQEDVTGDPIKEADEIIEVSAAPELLPIQVEGPVCG